MDQLADSQPKVGVFHLLFYPTLTGYEAVESSFHFGHDAPLLLLTEVHHVFTAGGLPCIVYIGDGHL